MTAILALTALAGVCAILLLFWTREHRMLECKRTVHALNILAAGVPALAAPFEMVRKMTEVIPGVLDVTGVRLYLYNRASRRLDRVLGPGDTFPLSIDPDSPGPGLAAGVTSAFCNLKELAVPDTRRCRLFPAGQCTHLPRALLFVPMVAGAECMGVLELRNDERTGGLPAEERTFVQHLANQVAAAWKLEERRTLRERTIRGEELAASARLISEAVGRLRGPIHGLRMASEKLLGEQDWAVLQAALAQLAAEAGRACDTVERLSSFARAGGETAPVDLNGLVSRLVGSREGEWKRLGIEVRGDLCGGTAHTDGVESQLERLFLDVLTCAERSVGEAAHKTIRVSTRTDGRRILVEVEHPSREDVARSGLAAWRSIVEFHGGELRLSRPRCDARRVEIDLPLSGADGPTAERAVGIPVRTLTTLVIEPAEPSRSRLLRDLSLRGHRVVPVANEDEGIDLARRLRFEVVFCAMQLTGSTWTECHDRIRDMVGAFVLIGDGFDPDLLKARECFVLHRSANDLDAVLAEVEASLERENSCLGR